MRRARCVLHAEAHGRACVDEARGVTRACAKRPSGEKRAARRGPVEDPVKRRFEAGGADMAQFTDIACVKTRQGRLHPAPAMDI